MNNLGTDRLIINMAETKQTLERIYTIPLRRACMKVPHYKRARKGIVTIKEFIAKHMKVPHREIKNVKIDMYLNNALWFRGPDNAPPRVKVKAVKNGDIVHVTFVEVPSYVKFAQAKHARFHKKSEKKAEKTEEKKEEVKTEEEKKAESEKEKSAALAKEQIIEQQTKAKKHPTKAKRPEIHRMALTK